MKEVKNNWQVKSLSEVADIIAGQSPPSSTYNYTQDGLPFFQGKVDFGITFPKVRVWCNDPVKIANPNDILICVRAPVGPTNICDVESCIGRGLSAIRSKENSLYKYIFYYLRSIEVKIANQGRGSTFRAITQNELRELKIPLPPLPIQKQIAEILEQADKAKQKRKEASKLTDEFLQSVFFEMFGDPIKNPKGWEKVNLDNIGDWQSGGTPSRSIKKYFEGEIPWYSSGELNSMYLTDSDECITEEAIRESNAKIIEPNSILVGMYDTAAFKLGITINHCSCNQAIAYSKLDAKKINTIFLYFLMQIGRDFFISGQRGVRQKNLNLTMIRETKITLPPLSLQQQFAEIVNKTEALKEKQKQSELELENLFQSLMQKAFKGEFV